MVKIGGVHFIERRPPLRGAGLLLRAKIRPASATTEDWVVEACMKEADTSVGPDPENGSQRSVPSLQKKEEACELSGSFNKDFRS